MGRVFFAFSLLFLVCFPMLLKAGTDLLPVGQGGSQAKSDVKTDRMPLRPLVPDSGSIEDYRRRREFRYETPPPVDMGFWARLMRRLSRFWDRLFGNPWLNNLIVYFILSIAFIVVIYRLLGKGLPGLLLRKPRAAGAVEYDEQVIREVDFDSLINSAVSQRDFRLAVRFSYLKLLQLYDQKGLIRWQPNKANSEYAAELKPQKGADFERLVRIYEYCWYGMFPVDEALYKSVFQSVNALSRAVVNGEKISR